MGLARFGVSLEKDLLEKFDSLCRQLKYKGRSEAIRDLIRDRLIKKEWQASSKEVTGVISIVYDHHKRELLDKLINIQHDHQEMIIASQHIHLDHDNCLEVIVIKGRASKLGELADRLRSTKGVKQGEFIMATTGRDLK